MSDTPYKNNYWSISTDEMFKNLETTTAGISDAEASLRLKAITGKLRQKTQFEKDVILFLSQFKSPLVLLLVITIVLSAILGETSDALIIFCILSATGVLSFFQERHAGKAIEKLRSMIRSKTNVLRNGKTKEVYTEDIVPGDILLLASGDILPADCVLLESKDVYTNEAVLTGESYPAEKEVGISAFDSPLSKRKNVLFQGTSIVSGSSKAMAVLTDSDTILGQTAARLSAPVAETAFEKGIRQFGYLLMQVTIVLSIVILSVNIYFHKPVVDSLLFSLALAIGMAPELLPAIMTIAMSTGAKRMAAQKVIIKKLSSIQNLGEVNLLCSDKTGTLTEGVLKVSSIVDAEGNACDKTKTFACLNASFETGFPNPMDDALKKVADISTTGYVKADEVPYDFIRKRLSIAVKKDDKRILITKGAFNNIIEICTRVELPGNKIEAVESAKEKIKALYQQYSNDGFRAIGVCYKQLNHDGPVGKEEEKDMIFTGFVLLFDPPKDDVIKTILELKQIGVSLKMITGDNQLVAAYVSKQIGLTEINILTGKELQQMSTEALVQRVPQINIFAEIEPQQKERIIQAFQKAGNAVAYMGDGINDVAAINAADVGISINNAVDVAKDAADVVLLEKDLGVLKAGIIEGRRTFVNTLKYIYINTGSTFGNMFSVAGASLILPFLPMLPKQILMTNFLTDFPYMSVASDNVDEDQLSTPQKWNLKQIRNFMIVFGLHSSIFDFITFFLLYNLYHASPDIFRTGWFVESVCTELLILFIVRTQHSLIKSKPGKLLIILNGLAFVITILLPYSPLGPLLDLQPLGWKLLTMITGILFAYTVTADLLKIIFFRKWKHA